MNNSGFFAKIFIRIDAAVSDDIRRSARVLTERTRGRLQDPGPKAKKLYENALAFFANDAFACAKNYCVFYGGAADTLDENLLSVKAEVEGDEKEFFTSHVVSQHALEIIYKSTNMAKVFAMFPELRMLISKSIEASSAMVIFSSSTDQIPFFNDKSLQSEGGVICDMEK